MANARPGAIRSVRSSPIVVSLFLGLVWTWMAGAHTISKPARDIAGNQTTSTPASVTVVNGSVEPSAVGQWEGPFSLPMPPVHLLLQRTGQVLMFDESTGGSGATLWDAATGTFTPVPTASNLFCAGHTALADGRSIVIGGHLDAYRGIPDTNLFDPMTRTWSRAADMTFARWYPTATTLPNGRVLATSGWITPGQLADTPEVYDPKANSWTGLTAATRSNPMYSFMFVLPDGTVFNAGPDVQTRRLDVATQAWTDVGGSLITGHSAVMYEPGKVMKSGTFAAVDNPGPSVHARTVFIDLNLANPSWREGAPMAFPRSYHNLVLLPDGTVLVVGGGRTQDGYNVSQAVHEAELWDPATQAWSTMAPMQRPRLHHSTALLLADGRVVSAGGEVLGGSYREENAEIYSPPYLFRGPRPTITSVPPSVQYGARFFLETANAPDIARVSLIRTGLVTHGFNQNQRYLRLTFTPSANGLDVQAPLEAKTAPPGDYMLFVVNSNGVPSVGQFVNIGGPTGDSQPPSAPANLVASLAGGSVGLSWDASTDDVGVTHYNVHRATVSGFTPMIGNRIGQPSTTNFTDADLPNGTYFYVVTAGDGSGNASPPSNQVTVSVQPDITVTPTALAFGNVVVKTNSAYRVVTVSNDGTASLSIGTVTQGGTNRNQFSTANDSCSGRTLARGQACTVSVRFSPTTRGLKTATLVISSNDPDENPVAVQLSGTGTRR